MELLLYILMHISLNPNQVQINVYHKFENIDTTLRMECILEIRNNSLDTIYYPLRYGQDVLSNIIISKPLDIHSLQKQNMIEIPNDSYRSIIGLYAINPGGICMVKYSNNYKVNKKIKNPSYIIDDFLVTNMEFYQRKSIEKTNLSEADFYGPNLLNNGIHLYYEFFTTNQNSVKLKE